MDRVLNLLKLLTKWKPDWLYEAMPCLYLVIGLVVMLFLVQPPVMSQGPCSLSPLGLSW